MMVDQQTQVFPIDRSVGLATTKQQTPPNSKNKIMTNIRNDQSLQMIQTRWESLLGFKDAMENSTEIQKGKI